MLACRQSFCDTGRPEIGVLELLSTEQGLVAILFCGDRRSPASEAWRSRNVGSVVPARPGEHEPYEEQLRAYFAGTRTLFTFALHRTGTPFQRAVLDAVSRVPHGGRASYQAIAREVGAPAASRAVGAANARKCRGPRS